MKKSKILIALSSLALMSAPATALVSCNNNKELVSVDRWCENCEATIITNKVGEDIVMEISVDESQYTLSVSESYIKIGNKTLAYQTGYEVQYKEPGKYKVTVFKDVVTKESNVLQVHIICREQIEGNYFSATGAEFTDYRNNIKIPLIPSVESPITNIQIISFDYSTQVGGKQYNFRPEAKIDGNNYYLLLNPTTIIGDQNVITFQFTLYYTIETIEFKQTFANIVLNVPQYKIIPVSFNWWGKSYDCPIDVYLNGKKEMSDLWDISDSKNKLNIKFVNSRTVEGHYTIVMKYNKYKTKLITEYKLLDTETPNELTISLADLEAEVGETIDTTNPIEFQICNSVKTKVVDNTAGKCLITPTSGEEIIFNQGLSNFIRIDQEKMAKGYKLNYVKDSTIQTVISPSTNASQDIPACGNDIYWGSKDFYFTLEDATGNWKFNNSKVISLRDTFAGKYLGYGSGTVTAPIKWYKGQKVKFTWLCGEKPEVSGYRFQKSQLKIFDSSFNDLSSKVKPKTANIQGNRWITISENNFTQDTENKCWYCVYDLGRDVYLSNVEFEFEVTEDFDNNDIKMTLNGLY